MNAYIRTVALAGVVVAAGGMNGQCNQMPGGQACTPQAVASVVLNIRDATGAVVPRAEVDWVHNGMQTGTASCIGNCGQFAVVSEKIGRLDLQVFSVGLAAQSLTVQVALDAAGCHPVPVFRNIVMPVDNTIGVLNGVWQFTNIAGQSTIVRFGRLGEPIGAILTQRVNTGDTNIYVAYNGKRIAGSPGQPILSDAAPMPTRAGNIYNWTTTSGGFPVGFMNAAMSADLNGLMGTLLGAPATYTRLASIPDALKDAP